MILCLGGGTTQAAVLAMYGIVAGETVRAGGLYMDESIVSYVRKKYGVIIGQPTAENVKISIGAALPFEEARSIEIQGQDQVTGLPRPITLTTEEVIDAIEEPLRMVVETARRTLEKTPPELVSDIIDRGVALCGGGALLPGLDRLLTKELGVPTYRVDHPTTCVAEGASKGLAMYSLIRRSLPTS
jgi:rod shape-determining protein MreB